MTEKTIKILNENVVVDTYLLYSFIRRLVTPFDQTDAFKLGIIDKDGNALKKRKDLTSVERSAYSLFDVLVYNIKKLIEKLPGGKTRLATFAAALFLLKEEKSDNIDPLALDYDYLSEMFADFMEEVDINKDFREQLEAYLKDLEEDAPAMSISSGGIAGVNLSPGESPPVSKKKQKEYVDSNSQSTNPPGRRLNPFF